MNTIHLGWDYYITYLEDDLASFFINLDARPEHQTPPRPVLFRASINLQQPGPDGLSTEAEKTDLYHLEDELVRRMSAECDALFVGRMTSQAVRRFYFYLPSRDGAEAEARWALSAFPEYPFELRLHDDPKWRAYFEALYPTREERQCLWNRRRLQQIELNGDALNTERAISHRLNFRDVDSRRNFKDAARSAGYNIVDKGDNEGDEDFPHYLVVSIRGVPDAEHIDETTLNLIRLADENNAQYEGWDLEIIPSAAEKPGATV